MGKPKGPTWNDIHAEGANNIVSRETGGYNRKHSGYGQHGHTRIEIDCPFCPLVITAYLWSLAGGGKRCDCGALLGSSGTAHHFASYVEKK